MDQAHKLRDENDHLHNELHVASSSMSLVVPESWSTRHEKVDGEIFEIQHYLVHLFPLIKHY